MADPVKHVVSVLKTALDQIQNATQGSSSSLPTTTSVPATVIHSSSTASQFSDAARRDFR